MRKYSPTTGNTYLSGVHSKLPADCIDLPERVYEEVIANPTPGKIRSHDADGLPILIDPPVYVPSADDHRAAVAAERYKRETAGVSVQGMAIDTGRDSQALITGAALAAMLDPSYSCRWKTSGGFVEMNGEQIISVASAVRAHVQACFDREAELLQAIDSGTYTDAMLDEGWPNEQVSTPITD